MLVLYETALGYCLFKVSNASKIENAEEIYNEFSSPERANKFLRLKGLHRFSSTATAVEDITAIQNGKLGKGLKSFLSEQIVSKGKEKESLLVIEPKLAQAIRKKFSINATLLMEDYQMDLWRGIREQLAALLDGLDPKDLATMSLGLSHSLSRFKLKFSPDKVDTMIVQAIALLDDLDKEINIYAMRVKEWYGWHFPEMAKIITDNIAYAKVIRAMGFRTNAASTSFAAILPEDLEAVLKAAAQISMGTDISDSDIAHIHSLCDQVISISTYRQQLSEYIRNRMNAIAPNLTALVGELVGARLISHAGSLLSLAKYPASTVQILGAEKALFRALKTKHDTPKYGLIYHASLIGQAPPKLKGKMARMVATKTALATRVDALTDEDGKSEAEAASLGLQNRAKLESRLRALEHALDGSSVPRVRREQPAFRMQGETKTYNNAADLIPAQREDSMDVAMQKEKKEKKDKKRKHRDSDAAPAAATEEERKARKKARKAEKEAAKAAGSANGDVPKKKKRKSETS
ncbi:Nop-domain-containing protein [Fistulina hepatica ATCC 64428]|uniref:Nucleolar protein 58 n=1 Tax=Fistulina hepatica ATCC 64428 TaxID=1128425 RepID=A0A0D7A2T9_9AGAR|nr:Nop-domain-containing protein [Fistulina hepatica ATCC 64428]